MVLYPVLSVYPQGVLYRAFFQHRYATFFPATGKKGTLEGSTFLIVKGNQVMEGWNQMDLQALMQKLQAN